MMNPKAVSTISLFGQPIKRYTNETHTTAVDAPQAHSITLERWLPPASRISILPSCRVIDESSWRTSHQADGGSRSVYVPPFATSIKGPFSGLSSRAAHGYPPDDGRGFA